MQGLNIINLYPETIADGYGLRYAIYLAGCRHACPGCHNPESWSPTAGQPLSEEILTRIIDEINGNSLLDGITLTGGDPFYNPEALLVLLQRLKSATQCNIWCYTGYTYEALVSDAATERCLHYIDTLVDGPFVQRLYDPALHFRGSSNQRILHLHPQASTIAQEGGYRP
jgi:anaerobic ribonucleoside-triphosphate reductase activating protein